MLTATELAMVKTAAGSVDRNGHATAEVLSDSLVERGQLLGEFMRASMARPRTLGRERELLPEVVRALRDAGLKGVVNLAFCRGLPVGAMARAEEFFRRSSALTEQWPLEELWLEGSDGGAFFAALKLPVLDGVKRLALHGSLTHLYTRFADTPPKPIRALPALRWLRPPSGELPRLWAPLLLPGFVNVETLDIDPEVDLASWLDALPGLRSIEVRLREEPEGDWARATLTQVRQRGLELRVNGVTVSSFEALRARGLLASDVTRTLPLEFMLSYGDAEPSSRAAMVERFYGQTLTVVPTDRSSVSKSGSDVHRQLALLARLPPLPGITQVASLAANRTAFAVTFAHRLAAHVPSSDRARDDARALHMALRELARRGVTLEAVTTEMLYTREGALELFPVTDQIIRFHQWPSAERLVGLPLLPEHHGTEHGVDLLVRAVERQWVQGEPLAPASWNELSLRRAWRQLLAE